MPICIVFDERPKILKEESEGYGDMDSCKNDEGYDKEEKPSILCFELHLTRCK